MESELLLIDTVPAWWAGRTHPSQTPPEARESAAPYREKLAGLWTTLLEGSDFVRYVLLHDGQRLSCGFSTELPSEDLAASLRGVIPGAQFRSSGIGLLRGNWVVPSVLEGVPVTCPTLLPAAADRLISAMGGKPFLLFVEAQSRDERWIRVALSAIHEQSETLRFEQMRHPQSSVLQDQLRQLDTIAQRYRQAGRERLAAVLVSVTAQTARERRLAEQILGAAWAAPDGQPSMAWRPWTGEKRFNGMLASEIVEIAHLPLRSYHGYQITAASYPRTAVLRHVGRDDIHLGEVVEGGTRTGKRLPYSARSLFGHALVAGSPGSGKTTASLNILRQLKEDHNMSFLVIEPAIKREFRSLISDRWAQPLQLFSVGDAHCALRLNLLQPQGMPLATHLGHVRALLLSAFAWVPPQQYVLEQALHRVYEDRGFDLTTGRNLRGDGTSLWPTLSDLEEVIPRVVSETRYDAEISSNLMAGLCTRIAMLGRGPIGQVLNSRRTTSIEELLAGPAVVELALLGDDEQKCLLMGALLIAIAEYRMSRGPAQPGHLLVIEEAHRLLRNADTSRNDETANSRGQALETIANLMSELRAFNQGLLVIEQSPSQLHPSVLATANLKIALRTAGARDRVLLASELNLDEAQQSRLLFSAPGRGIVLGAGMPGPYEVQFPPLAQTSQTANLITGTKAQINGLHVDAVSPFHRFGIDRCGHRCLPLPDVDARRQVRLATLVALLAIAAEDDPAAIAKFITAKTHTLVPEPTCCLVQATADSLYRQKGLSGRLNLAQEDEITSEWYALVRALTVERATTGRIVESFDNMQSLDRAWRCSPTGVLAPIYEARILASVGSAVISEDDHLPKALCCYEYAVRARSAATARAAT